MHLGGVHLSSGQPGLTQFWSWLLDASTGGTSELSTSQYKCQADLTSTVLGHWLLEASIGGTSDIIAKELELFLVRGCDCWFPR